MIALRFEKLYKDARMGEPCSVAIPLKQGALFDVASVCVMQAGVEQLTQCKVTSRYGDGSIRWLFVRFLADLPGNGGTTLYCDLHHGKVGENVEAVCEERGLRIPSGEEAEKGKAGNAGNGLRKGISCERKGDVVQVDCGALRFSVKDGSRHIIESLWDGRQEYGAEQWEGPYLKDGAGKCYGLELEDWRLMEAGPVCAVVKAKGWCVDAAADERRYGCEVKLTAYYGKPWIEVSYTLTNTSMEPLKLESLVFALKLGSGKTADTGALRFTTTGTGELEDIEAQIPLAGVRTCVATSNYRTRFEIAGGGQKLSKVINEQYVYAEGCEHFAEVYYGTFFADRTGEQGGVCAAVFQAYQNYPKALEADGEGLRVLLVPEGESEVVMEPGMAREQRFQLHFHGPEETLTEVDNRAIIYQMPDRPVIAPEVYEAAGVMPDIFVEAARMDMDTEAVLIAKCDAHARCFGMLNWGDAPDPGYTAQGRGHGAPVWTNNEYDFTHACALLYARTGLRRFLDYALVSGSHWKDVDVCHYSTNPLHLGGHWEHTHGHVKEGSMVCSHEWVEGLLDCWHFTGDENYRDTAVGIAENVLRLLETPMYQKSGEFSARETGWPFAPWWLFMWRQEKSAGLRRQTGSYTSSKSGMSASDIGLRPIWTMLSSGCPL